MVPRCERRFFDCCSLLINPIVLLVLALLSAGRSVTGIDDGNGPHIAVETDPPACTVEQLIGNASHPGAWVDATNATRPSYGCSCPYYKARYFCPHLSEQLHHYVWQPYSIAGGECKPTPIQNLVEDLFPPDHTVFIFGNSHIRQPMEALLCQFSDQVVERNSTVKPASKKARQELIGLDWQCRGFSSRKKDLVDNNCVDGPVLPQCKDDTASFQFHNGASLHYRFNEGYHSKSINAEIAHMGLDPDNVDVIISNAGNGRKMSFESLIESAQDTQGSGKLILWLSNFYNGGNIYAGPQGKTLDDLGVVQFDMSMMMREQMEPVKERSCKVVEDRPDDTHYCMPGPPDELGILLARMVWADFVASEPLR